MNSSNIQDKSYILSQQWNLRERKFDLQQETSDVIAPVLVETSSEIYSLDVSENDKIISEEKVIIQPLTIENTIEERSVSTNDDSELTTTTSVTTTLSTTTAKNSIYTPASDFHLWLKNIPASPIANKSKIKAEPNNPSSVPIGSKNEPSSVPVSSKFTTVEPTIMAPISETLASLLAQQGYVREAKAMYEKLTIQFPEKKAIFAALIDKLKN
ncbi:MAG: hypothetical protein HOP11_10180 [Saprospiraceae bacterium]|nr:hypothetical protein [Saprospiraceae bacterium]